MTAGGLDCDRTAAVYGLGASADGRRRMVKVAPGQCPQLGSCASSGRA